MVTIKIGTSQRDLSDNFESWLATQINNRKKDGAPVVVEIDISENGATLKLAAFDCPMDLTASNRRYNPQEKSILRLWKDKGLNDIGFELVDLMSFLRELKRILW